jgi:hypothetical protein
LPLLLKELIEVPRADPASEMTGFPRHLTAFLALEVGEWQLAKKLLQQEQEWEKDYYNRKSALPNYSDDKAYARLAKGKAAYSDALIAGIAKAEAALLVT